MKRMIAVVVASLIAATIVGAQPVLVQEFKDAKLQIQQGDKKKEIDSVLPNKPEYVVNTSENVEMRERLFALQNQRKIKDSDPNRPRRFWTTKM